MKLQSYLAKQRKWAEKLDTLTNEELIHALRVALCQGMTVKEAITKFGYYADKDCLIH